MDKKNIIDILRKTRKLSSEKEYELFEEALVNLQGNILIDDIDDLCKVFYDDTSDDEIMFDIVHMMEELRGEEYLKKIAINSPDMEEAHDWAMVLNKRIINNNKYMQMYISVICSLDCEKKKKILSLLDDIKKDNPLKFSEKIDYIYELTRDE